MARAPDHVAIRHRTDRPREHGEELEPEAFQRQRMGRIALRHLAREAARDDLEVGARGGLVTQLERAGTACEGIVELEHEVVRAPVPQAVGVHLAGLPQENGKVGARERATTTDVALLEAAAEQDGQRPWLVRVACQVGESSARLMGNDVPHRDGGFLNDLNPHGSAATRQLDSSRRRTRRLVTRSGPEPCEARHSRRKLFAIPESASPSVVNATKTTVRGCPP
jgi:hypothetical protein